MTTIINGTRWRVNVVNPSHDGLLRSDGTRTLGTCDDALKTIFIASNLSEYMSDKVLCHELVHAFCFEYGYYLDIQTEEIVADFMSLYGRDVINMTDDIMNLLKRSKIA